MYGMQPLKSNPKVGLAVIGTLLAVAMAPVALEAMGTAMLVARFAPAGVVVGKTTWKLVDMLQEAGPGMSNRVDAVSRWTPPGQQALMTYLDAGARMMSGGTGERARQILLQPNGETIVKALNVSTNMYEIIAIIRP